MANRIWTYAISNNLLDNQRRIIADSKLELVFGKGIVLPNFAIFLCDHLTKVPDEKGLKCLYDIAADAAVKNVALKDLDQLGQPTPLLVKMRNSKRMQEFHRLELEQASDSSPASA